MTISYLAYDLMLVSSFPRTDEGYLYYTANMNTSLRSTAESCEQSQPNDRVSYCNPHISRADGKGPVLCILIHSVALLIP
ncbi:hypothetical protein OE88DRAFT_1652698 [Heliocybe sulcata]|uniref:Uncharacterized protein n=1 Tax=Heliocybe sulcata TaxID=5364 RepID=A0A5C3NFH2_9AGAM|nr:hypothetical protein OE88DRAFT_1652698 [Heliocybe sulcata]